MTIEEQKERVEFLKNKIQETVTFHHGLVNRLAEANDTLESLLKKEAAEVAEVVETVAEVIEA